MRYECFNPAVNRDSLHPDSVYLEELRLARAFVEAHDHGHNIDPCPITGESRYEVFFEKWGARYVLSPSTWTLALSSIPEPSVLDRYFFDSDLARLRATTEYQTLAKNTRRELWEHQAEWLDGRIRRYLGRKRVELLDWGSKALGWLDAARAIDSVTHCTSVNPLPPVVTRDDRSDADVVCLFDVIQRSGEPLALMAQAVERLRPGGLLVASCRSGAGFDVLTLGAASTSIFPFDHICLPSPKGMGELVRRSGLELLELTTPGMLDVQLVRAAEKTLPGNRYFQRYLLDQGTPEVHERLQVFLQQNNLSSHLRIVARKPQEGV